LLPSTDRDFKFFFSLQYSQFKLCRLISFLYEFIYVSLLIAWVFKGVEFCGMESDKTKFTVSWWEHKITAVIDDL